MESEVRARSTLVGSRGSRVPLKLGLTHASGNPTSQDGASFSFPVGGRLHPAMGTYAQKSGFT